MQILSCEVGFTPATNRGVFFKMTVSELITYLQTQPQDLQVIYACYSEFDMLKASQIAIREECEPRPDGWVHHERPDKPSKKYLAFPGN